MDIGYCRIDMYIIRCYFDKLDRDKEYITGEALLPKGEGEGEEKMKSVEVDKKKYYNVNSGN